MPHALAVDDDPNFLSALAELIEGQGFTTNTACTLRDARVAGQPPNPRRGPDRPLPARRQRHRAAQGPRARRLDRGGADDRPRRRRERRPGAAPRRQRLPDQAARHRPAEEHPGQRGQRPAGQRRPPPRGHRDPGGGPARPAAGGLAADAGALRDAQPGGADRRLGLPDRRERHRQGPRRADAPPAVAAGARRRSCRSTAAPSRRR